VTEPKITWVLSLRMNGFEFFDPLRKVVMLSLVNSEFFANGFQFSHDLVKRREDFVTNPVKEVAIISPSFSSKYLSRSSLTLPSSSRTTRTTVLKIIPFVFAILFFDIFA